MEIKKIIFAGAIFFIIGITYAVPARADVLGEQKIFYIDNEYEARGRTQVAATVRGISEKAYLYVGDEYWNGLSASGRDRLQAILQEVSTEFDTRIYPLATSFFGSEPNPGIDNDPKITLAFVPLRSTVGGFFDSANQYNKTQVPVSNEREMLFLNIQQFGSSKQMYPFIVHEFQHLISFHQREQLRRVSDGTWLNELRSEYAIELLGYNNPYLYSPLDRRVSQFLQNPSDSLTDWPNTLADYGQVTLFSSYLAQHYTPQVIAKTSVSTQGGVDGVEEALRSLGYQDSFEDVFEAWTIANYLNTTVPNIKYGYTDPNLQSQIHVPATRYISDIQDGSPISLTLNMGDWEKRWFDIQNLSVTSSPILRIMFPQEVANINVPYLTFKKDGSMEFDVAEVTSGAREVRIRGIGTDITRVLVMPYSNTDRVGTNSPTRVVAMTLQRASESEVLPPAANERPTTISPEYYGLREGDFIQATNDKDVYIINQFGYKRIVLSPKICLLYGHLGARGCFESIRKVTPEVRDAFITSPYYTNGETNNGTVFKLVETGEDDAYLELTQYPLDNTVFRINNREQSAYTQ